MPRDPNKGSDDDSGFSAENIPPALNDYGPYRPAIIPPALMAAPLHLVCGWLSTQGFNITDEERKVECFTDPGEVADSASNSPDFLEWAKEMGIR